MNSRTICLGMLVAGSALLLAVGCKTVEPGVSNEVGTIETRLNDQPDAITKAAVKSVEDLKLTLVSSKGSKVDGVVIARTAQDAKVTITVERETDEISRLWIRVGKTGDQDVSMMILEKIKENLGPVKRHLP